MKHKPYRILIYTLVRTGIFVVAFIPMRISLVLAKFIGTCVYRLLGKETAKVKKNLDFAYGDSLNRQEKEKIAKGVFQHFGLVIAEMLQFHHWHPGRLEKIVEMDPEDKRRLHAIYGQRKGVIIAATHLGNWELLGGYLNQTFSKDKPLFVVAKRIYYEHYNAMLIKFRERFGVTTVYRDTPFLKIVKHLKKGGSVGILTDQDIQSISGIFVPFFGKEAYTSDTPAKLAKITGSPIVPTFLIREGKKLRVLIDEPIFVNPEKNKQDEFRRITEAISMVTEKMVRRFPEQWVWMHRRWKTIPEIV